MSQCHETAGKTVAFSSLQVTHRNDKLTTSITAETLTIFRASISRFGDITFYLKHSIV